MCIVCHRNNGMNKRNGTNETAKAKLVTHERMNERIVCVCEVDGQTTATSDDAIVRV